MSDSRHSWLIEPRSSHLFLYLDFYHDGLLPYLISRLLRVLSATYLRIEDLCIRGIGEVFELR